MPFPQEDHLHVCGHRRGTWVWSAFERCVITQRTLPAPGEMRMFMSLIDNDDESAYVSDREWWEWLYIWLKVMRVIMSLIESDENDLRPTPVLQRSPKPTGGVWVIRTSVSAGTWLSLNEDDDDYCEDDDEQKPGLEKTTCCHFFRQSAPLGRLKAHPLNSGCHGVPDWSSLIDVIVPWQILKNMFPGLSWSWMFKVDIWNVKHIHILFIRFWVDLISTKKVQDISKAVKLIYFQRIFFFSNFKENSVKDDDAHIFLFVVNLQWWN